MHTVTLTALELVTITEALHAYKDSEHDLRSEATRDMDQANGVALNRASIDKLIARLNAPEPRTASDYRSQAKRIYSTPEGGDIEVDDHATVSVPNDHPHEGAYVAAWVWVPAGCIEPQNGDGP